MTPYGSSWEEELNLLFAALPPRIASAAQRLSQGRGDLLEVVLDLGREPEARFTDGEAILDSANVGNAEIEYVTEHVGLFGDDNRAGIERTLHRISAIRNRAGDIVGLTCRVGRAVTGTIDIIKDMVISGQSILCWGRPASARPRCFVSARASSAMSAASASSSSTPRTRSPATATSRTRGSAARDGCRSHAGVAARGHDRSSREPHAAVHRHRRDRHRAGGGRRAHHRRARRATGRHGARLQHRFAARQPDTQRPARRHPDGHALRRGGAPARTQKSVLERKSPPTSTSSSRFRSATASSCTRHSPRPSTRRCAAGSVRPNCGSAATTARSSAGSTLRRCDAALAVRARAVLERSTERATRTGTPAPLRRRRVHRRSAASRAQHWEQPAQTPAQAQPVRTGPPLSIFPYGVSRSYLEQSLREMRLPVRIQHHIDDADVVLTLKNYYRRHDSPVRAAESSGIPIHVLRSNTVAQIKGALARVYGVEAPVTTRMTPRRRCRT